MKNPLKPKIKQSIEIPQEPDLVLEYLEASLTEDWQLHYNDNVDNSIDFVIEKEGLRLEGVIQRWQGTESKLRFEGEVTSKVPYQAWREWSPIVTFLFLMLLWSILSLAPIFSDIFSAVYKVLVSGGGFPALIFILSYWIAIPLFVHYYLTKLAPSVKAHHNYQADLASVTDIIRSLQNPPIDSSRLQDSGTEIDELIQSEKNRHTTRHRS